MIYDDTRRPRLPRNASAAVCNIVTGGAPVITLYCCCRARPEGRLARLRQRTYTSIRARYRIGRENPGLAQAPGNRLFNRFAHVVSTRTKAKR